MNHLIIYMHPTETSFNGAILDEYVNKLELDGNKVKVRNLYSLKYDPLLTREEYKDSFQKNYHQDVKHEQEAVNWADIITFSFPYWWGGFPAIGKGYIDRVFSFGFAYRLDGESPVPLLKGKKAVLMFTSGTPEKEMYSSGIYDSFINLTEKSIFKFCGLELIKTVYFGNVLQCGDGRRKEMIKEAGEAAVNLGR